MTEEYVIQRLDKVDNVLEKLTQVSVDLKMMLAVHEEKIGQHEKHQGYLEKIIEDRRILSDAQIDKVYTTMREQDQKILEEIKSLREDMTSQHKEVSTKISLMEKYIWMAIGGGILGSWVISELFVYFKLVH
jgi:hypothetical protein